MTSTTLIKAAYPDRTAKNPLVDAATDLTIRYFLLPKYAEIGAHKWQGININLLEGGSDDLTVLTADTLCQLFSTGGLA